MNLPPSTLSSPLSSEKAGAFFSNLDLEEAQRGLGRQPGFGISSRSLLDRLFNRLARDAGGGDPLQEEMPAHDYSSRLGAKQRRDKHDWQRRKRKA
jgi:hypothetical protein